MTASRDQNRFEKVSDHISFWRWLWRKGLRRFLDGWLLAHLGVGILLHVGIDRSVKDSALAVFVPVGAIAVGLTFSWGASASALLQSPWVREVGAVDGGQRFRNWVFSYQLAVLTTFVVLIAWALVALGIGHRLSTILGVAAQLRVPGRVLLFPLSSLAVRECWQVVSATQTYLLIGQLVEAGTASKATTAAEQAVDDPAAGTS
jgi:hypothetical protein